MQVVQFCGHDPDILLAATKMVEPVADAIDFNLGCPQVAAVFSKGFRYSFSKLGICCYVVI